MLAGSIWVVDGDPVIGIGCKPGWKKAYHAGKRLFTIRNPKAEKEKCYDLVFIDKAAQGNSEFGLCRKVGKICAKDIRSFMSRILDSDHAFKNVPFVYAGGGVVDLYKPFARQELQAMIQESLREDKI